MPFALVKGFEALTVESAAGNGGILSGATLGGSSFLVGIVHTLTRLLNAFAAGNPSWGQFYLNLV